MRKLASIQKILAVDPIEGADAIVRVKVLGWECVALKDEFKVGDTCVYFEIDSLLPVAPWTEFLRKGDDRPFRLKTVRMRGQISQGLAMPLTKLPFAHAPAFEEGADVTEYLGVEKWEAQVPAQLAGQVRGNFPTFLSKTDETRLQAEPTLLDEAKGAGVIKGRFKIDGTSFTAYVRFDGANVADRGVCSRNLDLKETTDNTYWRMARTADVFTKMEAIAARLRGDVVDNLVSPVENIAIQAELAGPGIQGNKMGYKELKLVVFNLIVNGRAVDDAVLEAFAKEYGFELAPVAWEGVIPIEWIPANLLQLANDLNYENGTPAEGIVWRPIKETYSKVLKGRMSWKTISNRFLLKYKE